MMKLLGAVLIIVGCGGVGFAMCQNHRYIERTMEQLIKSLDWMVLELNFRMPPLSELCSGAAKITNGCVSRMLEKLSVELERQLTPDVATCMEAVLASESKVPPLLEAHLHDLGTRLGQLDLQGQISELEKAVALCRRDVEDLRNNRDLRLRNYQTLGICAGVALVILFL